MSSDSSPNVQTPSGSPLPPDLAATLADMPLETLLSRIEELIAQGDLVRLFALSSEDLRQKFATDQETVEAVWLWLSRLLLEHVPDVDRMVAGIGMVDWLVSISGYDVSRTKNEFYSRINEQEDQSAS